LVPSTDNYLLGFDLLEFDFSRMDTSGKHKIVAIKKDLIFFFAFPF